MNDTEPRFVPTEFVEHRARVRKTDLYRRLRKLVRQADRFFVECDAVADELDDCPPHLHPIKIAPDDGTSDFAAADLRALARTVNVMLAAVRGEL